MSVEVIAKIVQKNGGTFPLMDAANVDYDGTGEKSIKEKIDDHASQLADNVHQLALKAKESDLLVERSRIDVITQTAEITFYEECLSTDIGALLTVASGATTGQINLASVTPVATGYTPIAGDYVRLVYGVSSGSAELIDARVGVDGITYDNTGNAVRGQINKIKVDLTNLGEDLGGYYPNLLKHTTWTDDYYVRSNIDGANIALNGYSASDYVGITGGEYYITNPELAEQGAWYDADKNYISGFAKLDTATQAPVNARYIRLSALTATSIRILQQGMEVHDIITITKIPIKEAVESIIDDSGIIQDMGYQKSVVFTSISASGNPVSISSFHDVDIAVTIDSNEDTTVVHTGKNVLFCEERNLTASGVTAVFGDDGTITLNGTSTAIIFFTILFPYALPIGNYTLFANNSELKDVQLRLVSPTTNMGTIYCTDLNAYGNIGATQHINQFTVRIASGVAFTNYVLRPMVLIGESSKYTENESFEVYFGIIESTIAGKVTIPALNGINTIFTENEPITVSAVSQTLKVENEIADVKTEIAEKFKWIYHGGLCNIFHKWGFIGDSLSSGEHEYNSPSIGAVDLYEYSFGKRIAKICGAEAINFSVGGASTRRILSEFGTQLYDTPSNLCQTYFIYLGVNDSSSVSNQVDLGTSNDIDLVDYNNNADTFYGNYAKIIQKLLEVQPKTKIFVRTLNKFNWSTVGDWENYNTAIRYMASIFDAVYLVDYFNDGPINDVAFRDKYVLGTGHLNAMGYQYEAYVLTTLMDKIINDNYADFKQVAFIGTDYAWID